MPGQGRVDATGTLLVTAGLTAIVLPLVEGRTHGWPLWTWLSLAAAPAILALFAVQQRRHPSPLISGELFGARGFTAGLVAQLVFWSGQASFFLVLALYLQQGRGLSALHSGLVFTILAVAYLAASLRAPALTERYGRRVLAVGALTLAAGHGLLALAAGEIGVRRRGGGARARSGPRRRRHGPRDHAPGDADHGRDEARARGFHVRGPGHRAERRQRDRRGRHRRAVLRRRAQRDRRRVRALRDRPGGRPAGRRRAHPADAGPQVRS